MEVALKHQDFVSVRKRVFSQSWPLDDEITAVASTLPSHRFLQNPASQYIYIYLTRYVRQLAEQHTGQPFNRLSVLDWGCGKGHISKLIGDLQPATLASCDLQVEKADSAFGQATPILDRFNITVKPLTHASEIPYPDGSFDIVLSFGVLEHVASDEASIVEIARILKPGGLFFCFFLPTKLSWTQRIARSRGDEYHDRLYTEQSIQHLTQLAKLQLDDMWYRQLLPKNTVAYPAFRAFEQLDQLMTRYTPLRYFATNIEFVAEKPR